MTARVAWSAQGWQGWQRVGTAVDATACLAAVHATDTRRSRHARTTRVTIDDEMVWVKFYPPPGARRARRALRMHEALARAGFPVPDVLLVGFRGAAGLLVTRDVGGEGLEAALARRAADAGARVEKRRVLAALGRTVGQLHERGFVHGDLVPSNVVVRGEACVLLDHDRTRRGRLLVWWGGRRNLVQLGRFVVRGLTLADRARVLVAYATARRLSRPRRHALARWLVAKTTARRCAIDGIAPDVAAAAGFRALMRSGGPFDPSRAETA